MSKIEDFMSGSEMIMVERKRQVVKGGWTSQHDDLWKDKELAKAALAYLARYISLQLWISVGNIWPWSVDVWDPKSSRGIRCLVVAGALIAAEIDRCKRLEEKVVE